MTRIDNVDRILLLMRAQLERLDKKKYSERSVRPGRQSSRDGHIDRLKAIAASQDASVDSIGRAFVHCILSDAFGAETAQAADFTHLGDRVYHIIKSDDASRELLQRVLQGLTET